MANPLIWITPTGTIADLLGGQPTSVSIQAIDTTNNIYSLTYGLASGSSLPPGLTINSNGVISGTPTLPIDKTDYTFTVRVTSTNSYPVEPIFGIFTVSVTNIINNGFAWITPSGDLGMIPNGEYYSLPFQANSTAGYQVTYSFISGELPAGMQLLSTGFLTGVPTFLNAVLVDQSQTYRFTVRATTTTSSQILDRSFSVSVTNVYGPTIQPTTGESTSLGQIFDGSYYNQQLTVSELSPAVQVNWSIIEGELPLGLTLTSTGLITGYVEPLELIGAFGPAGYDGISRIPAGTTCTLANSSINGHLLTVGSVTSGILQIGMYLTGGSIAAGTVVVSTITAWDRGADYFIDDVILYGDYYYKALIYIPPNTDFNISSWTVTTGSANLWRVTSPTSSPQRISSTTITGTIIDAVQQQEYDEAPYDFNALSQSLNYNFTIQAFDGANYDIQKYVLEIISRSGFTADTDNSVNDTYATADSNNIYIPILKDVEYTLPIGRAASHYAYKFQGYDFDGEDLTYSLANTVGTWDSENWDLAWDTETMNNQIDLVRTVVGNVGAWDNYDSSVSAISNLPGITLDADTGWLYGNITAQAETIKNFQFGVVVTKTVGNTNISSATVFFTLPVVGDINNIVEWVSPKILGSIDNGAVSELYVEARSVVNKELIYTLHDTTGVSIRLPQGLILLPSGDLSGRVSFEVFYLDGGDTTFDNRALTVDRTYNFTVKAEAIDESTSILRTFTILLNVINTKPYENLYLRALTQHDQRKIYNSIITNQDIFDPNLIYRPMDPWFGVKENIDMLFITGLTPSTLAQYEQAILNNHWTKTYNFDSIETAVVFDEFYKVKYEVVYISIADPAENADGRGAPTLLDLTTQITNPYIEEQQSYTVLYPNSSENMIKQLTDGIGYYDQSSLPPWMISNQPDPTSVSKFRAPLGYTKAVVLAYTKPGASKLIAYRLKQEGITFNNIEFTVDRYLVDNYYTTNFDLTSNAFSISQETTFDIQPRNNVGAVVGSVHYAVQIEFSEINGRPVSYVIENGGLDGRTDFTDGQTLIFVNQENFAGSSAPFNGWINYRYAFFGDDISTVAIEGYDSTGYDTYSVIPGYLEKIQGTSAVNTRGGIWQINIINDIIFLTSIQEVSVGQRIQIISGRSYATSIMYYNPILPAGYSVPYYTISTGAEVAISDPTTFNAGTTKFFNNRDQYYAPGTQDKYLKFPQYGVFK